MGNRASVLPQTNLARKSYHADAPPYALYFTSALTCALTITALYVFVSKCLKFARRHLKPVAPPYSSLNRLKRLTDVQKMRELNYKCFCETNVSHNFYEKPSIQCDMCGGWYHIACCKLTDTENEMLPEWYCQRCCDQFHISCICFEPEGLNDTKIPSIQCGDCKSRYHHRCVGLDAGKVNTLDRWSCGLCCDRNGEMRRTFVALRVFLMRNAVGRPDDYAMMERMISKIRASECMTTSPANVLSSASLMRTTVKRLNRLADVSKLRYDFSLLLTDVKEHRFGRMVDVIKAAGGVIDTIRDMLAPSDPSHKEMLQQLNAVDALLMASLKQTAIKCVFNAGAVNAGVAAVTSANALAAHADRYYAVSSRYC